MSLSLDSFPRAPLAHLPTPLERAPRLAKALGLRDLLIKRDDCTGLAMGGNKARKLEYLVADALRQRTDTLLTTGGEQSNHARMTAAAACRYGLRCELYLSDAEPARRQGNLLLDHLFGAEVRFHPGLSYDRVDVQMAARAAQLAAAGRRPYIIPVGGSTALGCLGYTAAIRELLTQVEQAGGPPAAIVVAVGSTGTLAGMTLGVAEYLPGCRLLGISVSRRSAPAAERTATIASEAAALLGSERRFRAGEITVYDDWVGDGYGISTAAGDAAVRLAARIAGLVLDPVYTGKAFSGLTAMARAGEFSENERVLFWHTGGAPAMFARPPELGEMSGGVVQ